LAETLSRIFLKSWNSPYKELITRQGEYPAREHGEKRNANLFNSAAQALAVPGSMDSELQLLEQG
jgi:hypothetical protein